MSERPIDERVIPHDLGAERAILGSILIHPERINEIVDQLDVADFFRGAHQILFRAMVALTARGIVVDAITIRDTLEQDGTLERAGGFAYLTSLVSCLPLGVKLESPVRIVRDKATRRRLIHTATAITEFAYSGEHDAAAACDEAERLVFEVAHGDPRSDPVSAVELMQVASSVLDDVTNSTRGVIGLETGFDDLDAMTRGLQPGNLVLLAARISAGKTALALDMALRSVIEYRRPVAFFSLEMSKKEVAIRLVAAEARVDAHQMMRGSLAALDYQRLSDAMCRIGDSGLWVDDSPTLNVLRLRGKCRRLKAKEGLALVVVDYLQLLTPVEHRRGENRVVELAEISRALKQLAKELDVPVVALCQLNRAVEQRPDKRPQPSDLRESGALEQDADLVLLLHRPEMHQPKPENRGLAELIIAKHRNGPTGTIRLRWHKESMHFEPWR